MRNSLRLTHKTPWLLALTLTAGLLAACQPQATKPTAPAAPQVSAAAAAINNTVIQKSPNDDRSYAALLLANNLQVVLVSDPSLENSAASLAVGVGSAQDPADQQGLAHYLEHMLFLGTAKYPEPAGFMTFTQANGGMTNAFTAFDKTNYLFQINANKFDEALDRFSDYFKAPSFDATYSDKERNAVDNEWSMQKQQDAWILMRIDALTSNPANPRAQFNIGNLTTLADKPSSNLNQSMKAFYQRYYSANIMRLTLVGKQSIPELKILAEKYFASIPNKNIARPDINTPGLTPAQMSKSIHYQPQKDFKALYVDFPVQSNQAQWRLKPNEYVNHLLTSEENGTLCEQLRKLGLAVNTTSYFADDNYGQDGYLRVQVELTELGLKQQDKVVAAIFAYTNLLKRDGLNERYFRELQAMRSKDFAASGKQNPLQQAVQLSSLQFELPVENLLNAAYIYERYDAQAIKNVLDQLDTNKVRVWHISKQEKTTTPISYFDGSYAIADITPAMHAKLNNLAKQYRFNLPPLNNLFTDTLAPIVDNIYLKPKQLVSVAGVEAFLQHPTFYREDKGQISLEINTHLGLQSAKNVVLAKLLSDIYKKQNTALIDRAQNASLGIAIAESNSNSQAFFVSGYTAKHPQLLAELLKSFAALEFSQAQFKETLSSYQQELANGSKSHVYQQLYEHAARLTNKAQWRDQDLLAAANTVTLKDVIAYHRAVKRDPVIRIFAVGNYNPADITAIADTARKILPSKRLPAARTIAHYTTPTNGQWLEVKETVGLADSALMQVWFRAQKSDDEKAQLVILNAFLDKAFFTQLRTNEQLGYVVQSTPYSVNDVPGYALLVQSSNSDTATIKARMDKFRIDYLQELKNIDPMALEATKQAMIANIMQKPTDFYKEAGMYAGEFWQAKYNFDLRDRHLNALKMVSKDDLIKLYERLLLDESSGGLLLQIRGTNFKDADFASVNALTPSSSPAH